MRDRRALQRQVARYMTSIFLLMPSTKSCPSSKNQASMPDFSFPQRLDRLSALPTFDPDL